ncbi:ATP-binding protein [Burkholderia sp. 3C]
MNLRMTLRLWPDSLFGRLVAILAAGMFAGQLLTSTIWFDTHDYRTLEIPSRLFASRLADTVRLLRNAPDDAARDATLARLSDARYQLRAIAGPESATGMAAAAPQPTLARRAVAALIAGVIAKRLGEPIEVRLLNAQISDDAGRQRGILSLFNSRMPMGDFHLQMLVPGQGWLDVVAHEGQAGMQSEPGSLVADYLLRLYVIRFVAVCVLAFVAVRFALRPLRVFAKAAEALGRNIYRAPLALDGPQEVRSVAKAFNAMQQRLIDSFAERTRLLAAVSHDLRSPLTRLRLRTEMLPDASWRERLRGDLDEMEAMVRSTLDAVQGIEITEASQRIDIDSMLAGLAEDARDAGHAVRIEGRASAPYPGFARNLKRCLQNLVDNAIRHGGGTADGISIRVTDDAQALRIVIGDRGAGIADPALLERVFEPYFRAAGERDGKPAPDGTGLGLTIARGIAAAHGGTLTLRNRMDGERIDGLDAELVLPRDA